MTVADRLAGLSSEEKRALLARLLKAGEQKEETASVHPLSFGQRAWWFLHHLEPDNPAPNIVFAARVRSRLDVPALRRSLQRLVDRHATLRTHYLQVGGEPAQVVKPRCKVALREIDAAGWSDAALADRTLAEADRRFDLERGPVLRLTLFRRGEEDHVLLLVVHHIAADLWSLALLMSELRRVYPAERAGAAAELPPLPLEYAGFVHDQRRRLDGEEGERLWQFWRRELAGELPVLTLPADRPRRTAAAPRGGTHTFTLEEAETAALKALAQREGTTLFVLLLAAYAAWLRRVAGQEEVVVGSLVASGRTRPELAGIVGFLDNPVPFRLPVPGELPFRSLLAAVRSASLAALEHQDFPFSVLVERLQPRRDPLRAPIFQTMFLLQRPQLLAEVELMALATGTGRQAEVGGLALELFPLERRTVTGIAGRLDLTLAVADLDRRLAVSFQYDADLFAPAGVARMARGFAALLTAAAADLGRTVAGLPVLTAAEAHQAVVEWNDTAEAFPAERCLDGLFARQAERSPEATAVVDAGSRLTYRELAQRVESLSGHLRALGVGPQVRVGVCVERCADLVTALLGVAAAGGAYVPMDPAYPRERLAFMAADAGVRLVLAQERTLAALPAGTEARRLEDLLARPAADLPAARGRGDRDLAYIIYTSGSTGLPKGVMIDHRSAANTILDVNRRFRVGPADRVAALSSVCFDLSVWDVFGTLAAGGTVVVPDPSPSPDPAAWLARMERDGVTVWSSAPPLMELLAGWARDRGRRLPASLRLVMLSGDWIPVALPAAIRSLAPAAPEIFSLGGATEGSIWSIVQPIREVDPSWSSIPYGRPQANQRFHVLDRAGRPQPVAVPGELHIGGDGVALGYFGRPELTASRFVPDALGGAAGARLYRTGDLGRYLADGTIEFLGRLDDQVKIRGFRVEPGEVESVLAKAPGVRECAVLARPDAGGGKRLVAFVAAEAAATELRRFLRERLPEHMVPASFVPVREWPLNASGKLDRRALLALEAAAAEGEGEEEGMAPRGPAEELLAAVFAQVLGVERVGVHDSFFERGGHSLQATQVVSRVRDAFGVDLPLRALFELQTVAALAAAVEGLRRGGEEPPPLERRPWGGGPRPLSFAQERLWFFERLEPGRALYNMAGAAEVSGRLDPALWARALGEVVRRHEVLRARFAEEEGVPVLRVAAPAPVPVPVVDLRALGAGERRVEAERWMRREARRPFDVARAPLLRALLLRLEEEEHAAFFNLHHIVADGWSMGVLTREMGVLYDAFAAGEASPLPELPIQYADFAAWQREHQGGEAEARHLAALRRRLGPQPQVAEIAPDRPRPAARSYRGGHFSFHLPADLLDGLRALGRREGATLFMVLLTAMQAVVHRESGRDDVLLGTDVANRDRLEVEGLIGFFVNVLVLKTGFGGGPSLRRLLGRTREAALEAYAHQELPFERLVADLAPERSLARTPLFQLLFVLQNVPAPALGFSGLRLRPLAVDAGVARFELLLSLHEPGAAVGGGMDGLWTYDAELFDGATIERLTASFEVFLRAMLTGPDVSVHDIDTLRESEKERLHMETLRRRDAEAGRLRIARRRAVDLDAEVVRKDFLPEAPGFPLVVTPALADADLCEWAAGHGEELQAALLRHGAVLFRGFGLRGAGDFERFARILCPELYGEYGDLPREAVGERIYTSTPYPPDQTIWFHNESSQMHRWPLKQLFFCVQPAERGGETPIADGRRVHAALRPEILERFARHGVMYVRNFTEGLDVPWQEFFRTGERAVVEAWCRDAGLVCEWRPGGGLRTKKVCPAVARHPRTGERVFFNQIQAHHIACVDPEVQASLRSVFALEDLPRNVYYGDGEPIPDAVVLEVRDLYRELAVSFPWQEGDLLLVDNMLTAHSRNPYSGARKILVAMGEMVGAEDLEQP